MLRIKKHARKSVQFVETVFRTDLNLRVAITHIAFLWVNVIGISCFEQRFLSLIFTVNQIDRAFATCERLQFLLRNETIEKPINFQ